MLEFHRKKNEERGVSPSSLDKTSETMSAGSIQLPTPVLKACVHQTQRNAPHQRRHSSGPSPSDAVQPSGPRRARTSGPWHLPALYRPPLTSPDLVSVAIRIRTTTAFEFDKPSGFACSTSR